MQEFTEKRELLLENATGVAQMGYPCDFMHHSVQAIAPANIRLALIAATTGASQASDAEEGECAWGWDEASLNRSTSDIVPCVVNDGAGHRSSGAASSTHGEPHPAVVRGASGSHKPEADDVFGAVLPAASRVGVDIGSAGVVRTSATDHCSKGKVASGASDLPRGAHLAATRRVEEVHATASGVGVDVPAWDARAWTVTKGVGLDVDVRAINVSGANEVDDATVDNGGIGSGSSAHGDSSGSNDVLLKAVRNTHFEISRQKGKRECLLVGNLQGGRGSGQN